MPTGSLRQEEMLLSPIISGQPASRQMIAEADREVLVVIGGHSSQPAAIQYRSGTLCRDVGLGAEPSVASTHVARLISQHWRVSSKAWSVLNDADEPDFPAWQNLLATLSEQVHTSAEHYHQSQQPSQPREEELLDWDVAIMTTPARPSKTILASVEYRGRAKPKPVANPRESLDWDVAITTTPARPSKTILASVEYRGRAKPKPVTDPWD